MRTVTFRGGPIDGHTQTISDDDQQTFSSFVSHKDWVAEHVYQESATDRTIFEHTKCTYRFIVETDQPDEDGTVVNLAGMTIPDKIPVLFNFGMNIKDVITYCKVWVDGGFLMCEAMLEDKYLDLNPAIGFTVTKYHMRGCHKYYETVKLMTVGLCTLVNLNPKIKTIREQLKEQECQPSTG